MTTPADIPIHTEAQLIELDGRRRLTLRLGHHDRYLVSEEPDGTLIWRPAVVLTQDELALRQAPQLMENIHRALSDPTSRTRRALPE
jgi:hypothetical protein